MPGMPQPYILASGQNCSRSMREFKLSSLLSSLYLARLEVIRPIFELPSSKRSIRLLWIKILVEPIGFWVRPES